MWISSLVSPTSRLKSQGSHMTYQKLQLIPVQRESFGAHPLWEWWGQADGASPGLGVTTVASRCDGVLVDLVFPVSWPLE